MIFLGNGSWLPGALLPKSEEVSVIYFPILSKGWRWNHTLEECFLKEGEKKLLKFEVFESALQP